MKKKSEEENKKDNTGWNAFLELRRQAQRGMLRTMQQLSADAEKVGSAEMTLDEINAEIAYDNPCDSRHRPCGPYVHPRWGSSTFLLMLLDSWQEHDLLECVAKAAPGNAGPANHLVL